MSNLLWEAFVFAFFLIGGGIAYVIDDIFGTAMRAFFYKLTHKEGLAEGVKKGFIEGKKTSERLWPILIVGTLTFYLFGSLFASTVPGYIFLYLIALVATAVGFIAGPWFCRVYRKKDKALAVIDRFEKGEINIPGEAKAVADKVKDSVVELASETTGKIGAAFNDALAEAKKHVQRSEQSAEEDECSVFSEMNDNATAPSEDAEQARIKAAQDGIERFIKR